MKIEDAKVIKENGFSVLGYSFTDREFNLATEFKRVITLAFKQYPKEDYPTIASRLGVSARSLFRIVKKWDIDTGRSHNYGYDKNKII